MKSEILIDKLCEILDIKEKNITYMSVTRTDAKVSLEFIHDGIKNNLVKLNKEAEDIKVEFDKTLTSTDY